MAIVKIIAIRDRLDKRVNYAINGEKTTLDAGIAYAVNPEKTEQHFFASAINCESCETAFAEMQETKRRFEKVGGVVGYHFIQSFAPGEATPEQAHRIGMAFAEKLFGSRYEVVIGTHLDKAHLHNHIVVNSVSFVDGKKYHSSPGSYYFDVRGTSDALCRENGLSVIAPQGKGRHYAEWKAENTGMAIGLMTTAFAESTIDASKKASLNIYKYDITTASADGAWDTESYVSTGLHDDAVIDRLAKYAVQGVEFTYLRVADIAMNNEVVDGQRQVGVLYGFDGADTVLPTIGVTAADAHKSENGKNYYTSDLLNNKLSAALTANATTVKNALEAAVKNGTAMTETDASGHTSASDMEQGLYLVVETKVPENVTSTCNPFFLSLPMTTVDGTGWNYDVTVYPKNQTGNPTLDKTVREAKNSTGKNNGSLTDIGDGYAHTATASVGDTVEYQIISTLPTITSKATNLNEYTYVDMLSKGIKYSKNDVVIEFFKDAGCTDKITTWAEDSGKFTVTYDDTANTMTIRMTETGLSEINEAATVYTDSVKCGYSDCTMRVTYAATLTADAKLGDTDNPNEVTLAWKRTNTTFFDTLEDCCHVYTYGIDVLKQFSDNGGKVQNVKFLLHNDTDDVYVIAEQKDGVYYAKGFAAKKADATTLVPNTSGHIIVKGLEDDTYSLTETATDKGYILLKEAVKIVITTKENGACEQCGAKLLTATGTVNGKAVSMTDGNAIVPLTVINNPGFDLPKTGGYGTWMFTIGGVALLGAAAFIVLRSRKHKNER